MRDLIIFKTLEQQRIYKESQENGNFGDIWRERERDSKSGFERWWADMMPDYNQRNPLEFMAAKKAWNAALKWSEEQEKLRIPNKHKRRI